MATIGSDTKINAPLERVFEVFTDFQNAAARIEGIKSLEVLTEGPIGVGTQFREPRVMFGKEATEEMEITDFQPNKSFRVEAESCGSHYIADYAFRAENNATIIERTFNARPVTLMAKLMSPMLFFMKGFLKKCLEDDLTCLKNFIEQNTETTQHACSRHQGWRIQADSGFYCGSLVPRRAPDYGGDWGAERWPPRCLLKALTVPLAARRPVLWLKLAFCDLAFIARGGKRPNNSR